jgi:hypothetical protein
MSDVTFNDAQGRARAKLSFQRANAQGRIYPRLLIWVRFEALGENLWVFVPSIDAKLKFNEEVITVGSLVSTFPLSTRSGSHRDEILEFPITHAALRYINDRMVGSSVDLSIEFQGICYLSMSDENLLPPKFPGTEWDSLGIPNGTTDFRFQVARSEWYANVIQRVGTDEIIFAEIFVPRSESDSLSQALTHLQNAEKAFFDGHDPATFLHLRAAFEALPGANKEIFSGIRDVEKRDKLNAMMKSVVAFLHTGRHVAGRGEDRGLFSIDHADAGLALNLVKILLAYVSKLSA